MFLPPVLGQSLLLGDDEQPSPSRDVPWSSAMAKNRAGFLGNIPPHAAAWHHLQSAPGMEGWQVGSAPCCQGQAGSLSPLGYSHFLGQ